MRHDNILGFIAADIKVDRKIIRFTDLDTSIPSWFRECEYIIFLS